MKMKSTCGMMLSLVLVTAGWAVAGAGYEEIVDQGYPLARGGSVSLQNINGDVRIEVWESEEVRVYAVKSASSPELLEMLEVKVTSGGNELKIDTRYPSMRDSDSHGDSFTKVEYTLTVPRSAMLEEIELINGNLIVVGVEGGIEAETVNGDIMVRDCLGSAELGTVNGDIEAFVGHLGANDEVDLESVNGRLDLHLSSSIGADVSADSVHGSLRNDFGIEVHEGEYVGSEFSGSIGGGGPEVSLETVNGSIKLHRL